MKKIKSKEVPKMLTEVELELMNILWKLTEGSVAEVIKELPTYRDLAYTSVSTILRILEQKGILKARKEGRGHIYTPLMPKSEYEARAVKHVVDRVFNGAPVALVRQLLGSGKIEDDELIELKELINKLEKSK